MSKPEIRNLKATARHPARRRCSASAFARALLERPRAPLPPRILAACLLSAAHGALLAATNSAVTDEIPPLHPPRAEIPPTFWEQQAQHGHWVVIGCIVLAAAVCVGIWFLSRAKPPIVPLPEERARQSLGALRELAEDGAVLSQVSQVMRRYVAAAFGLGPEELTTTEFCRAIEGEAQVGPELAGRLKEFLRQCDERKFAPSGAGPALGAVARSLELIELAEARRAQLRSAVAAAAQQQKGVEAARPA